MEPIGEGELAADRASLRHCDHALVVGVYQHCEEGIEWSNDAFDSVHDHIADILNGI